MTAPYGFTHGEYLDTLYPGWIHVNAPDTLIIRECWRRLNTWPNITTDRTQQKGFIRSILAQHHANRELCAEFRL